MTKFEYIKNMGVDELAESATAELYICITAKPVYMSLFDTTAHLTKEDVIAYNKEWLAKEAKE